MTLAELWFVLVAVLWSGYFVLEGFDFGVGMLLPFLPRDERERSAMFQSIGPVWDGNEVWLVVAGGATFAAFPTWYATMFSGFYLALLLVLVCLIVRVLSFEWRAKSTSPRWRTVWTWANTVGSFGAPLVWGVGLSVLLYGIPIDSKGDFTGGFFDLFNWYSVIGGISVVVLFAYHGATYLTIRTTGGLCERAHGIARLLSVPAAVAVTAFLALTAHVAVDRNQRNVTVPLVLTLVGLAVLVVAAVFVKRRRSGWAFALTALVTALWVATLFASLYPRVMVSSTSLGDSLTIDNASSAHYTLVVMTVVATICVPVILLYQGWTYYVFRARVGGGELPSGSPPAAASGASSHAT